MQGSLLRSLSWLPVRSHQGVVFTTRRSRQTALIAAMSPFLHSLTYSKAYQYGPLPNDARSVG